MKKIFFTLGLLGISYGIFAQDNSASTAVTSKAMGAAMHSRDFLVIEFGYVGLTGTGASNINTKFNRTFNIALMYDIPLQKSNFSLAAGLGIGSDNYIFNNQRLDITNTSGPSLLNTDTYKKSKLSTTYLEIPLELRFRQVPDNANKGFKAAIGIKAGTLLNAHTRTVSNVDGFKVVEKENSNHWFTNLRYVGTARIGYGNFALFGTYALNNLFKDNSTYAVSSYSFGISISGL